MPQTINRKKQYNEIISYCAAKILKNTQFDYDFVMFTALLFFKAVF